MLRTTLGRIRSYSTARQSIASQLSPSSTLLLKDCTIIPSRIPVERDQIKQEFHLLPRDLRSLDSDLVNPQSTFLIRDSIVLTTPILRAIISHDRILFVADVDSEQGEILAQEVKQLLLNLNDGPFEFRAIEALFQLTQSSLTSQLAKIYERIEALLPRLESDLSPLHLREILGLKREVGEILAKGETLSAAVEAILSEDADLAEMYLSDAHAGSPRNISDHQSVEFLLEHIFQQLAELTGDANRLLKLLGDVEINCNLILAATRVRLQRLELQTAILAVSLGSGTYLTSIFGQNLLTGLENSAMAFYTVTGAGVGLMVVVGFVGRIRMRREGRSRLLGTLGWGGRIENGKS